MCLLLITAAFVSAGHCPAQTPESPRVRNAIDRGIAYLEQSSDNRVGARALVGLTLAKYGAEHDHPKIEEAVRAIQAAVRGGPSNVRTDIYSTGISIMCLVALDPSLYRPEIEILVESLHLRQKRPGAWGYPENHPTHGASCDTSMTQYGILGLWEAEDQAGVETSPVIWDRIARWLILTQDENGGFGYQGNPANRLGRRVDQAGIRHSMTAAALGSLYIVKDRAGIRDLKKRPDDDTPDAFVPFETLEDRAARIRTQIELRYYARAIADGNRWMEANYDVENLTGHIHYSLYALERYETLYEADRASAGSPVATSRSRNWYARGARYLLRTQAEDGSWESAGGAVPCTCFATLFLLGSTQKTLDARSVARYQGGALIGGRGLPEQPRVRLRDGQVVVQPLRAALPEVIEILAGPESPRQAAAREALADAAAAGEAAEIREHGNGLAYLALHGETEVRRLAIRALGRSGDLDQVPLLIHLLGDAAGARAAHQALQTLSRHYDIASLSEEPTADERRECIEAWTDWFRTVRPDLDPAAFDPASIALS